jgi:hypothetical protein
MLTLEQSIFWLIISPFIIVLNGLAICAVIAGLKQAFDGEA